MKISPNYLDERGFSSLLKEGAANLGLSLGPEQIILFDKYFQELLIWSQKINLVKRKDEREIIIKDFLDSLIAHKKVGERASLLDLGSGAGFPGIPLKIAKPSLEVFLYESSLRKVYFLQNIIRKLAIESLKVQWAGDEREENILQKFDFVISRAFGSLLKFCRYGLPFIKKGGILIAMKGKKGGDELQWALPELKKLGITVSYVDEFKLPFLGHKRIIIGLSC